MADARMVSKARQMRASLGTQYQPKLATGSAVVVVTERDVAGEAARASLTQNGVVVATGVPIGGVLGAEEGATVAYDYDATRSQIYPQNIRTVIRPPGSHNTGTANPLSTPTIFEIRSRASVVNGTVLAHGAVIVNLIAEQLSGYPARWELEVAGDDGTGSEGTIVYTGQTSYVGAIGGKLAAAIAANDVQWVTEITSGGHVNIWPGDYLLVRVESEEILVRRAIADPANPGDYIHYASDSAELPNPPGGRGYNGTTAAAHALDTLVQCLAYPVGFLGLLPNTPYWYRVRAAAPNGRVSAWSDWVGLTTEYDVTPPGWIPWPFAPTVTGFPSHFLIEWPPANVDAGDLAHYDLDISEDGTTWLSDSGAEIDTGNGNSHLRSAEPGQIRWFRVRAVDTSENASAWSDATRASAPGDIPPGTNLLTNPTFDVNTTGWSASGGETGSEWSFARVTTPVFEGAGAARLRIISPVTTGFVNVVNTPLISVLPGEYYFVGGYFRTPHNYTTANMNLQARSFTAGGALIQGEGNYHTLADLYTVTGDWTFLSWIVLIPPNAAQLQVLINLSSPASGNTDLFVDSLSLIRIGQVADVLGPVWSGGSTAGLAVTVRPAALHVTWDAVDETANLAHYELATSPDGSSYTTVTTGKDTARSLAAAPGQVRHFKVRALDRWGNASAYSDVVRATVPDPTPPGTNLLNNPTFLTDTSDWTATSLTAVVFTRDASVYFDAAGSGKLVTTRQVGTGLTTTELVSNTNEAVTAGAAVFARAYAHAKDLVAGDVIALGIQFRNSTGTIIAYKSRTYKGDAISQSEGNWTAISLLVTAPDTAAFMRVFSSQTFVGQDDTELLTSGTLWLDDLALVEGDQSDDLIVHHSGLSDNPGAAEMPLKSNASGGLTLVDLNLTGTLKQSTPYGCRVYRNTTLSVTNATDTAISYTTELRDTGGCFNLANPTRLVAPVDGDYTAGANIQIDLIADRVRVDLWIRNNAGDILGRARCFVSTASINDNPQMIVTTEEFFLIAGDYIEVVVRQEDAAARTIPAATAAAVFRNVAWLKRIA